MREVKATDEATRATEVCLRTCHVILSEANITIVEIQLFFSYLPPLNPAYGSDSREWHVQGRLWDKQALHTSGPPEYDGRFPGESENCHGKDKGSATLEKLSIISKDLRIEDRHFTISSQRLGEEHHTLRFVSFQSEAINEANSKHNPGHSNFIFCSQ